MMNNMSYQWEILQKGQLPLRPDRSIDPDVEHICTSTMIWPVGQTPHASNTLIVDPCFSIKGIHNACLKLIRMGASLNNIGYYYVAHDHFDHTLKVPGRDVRRAWKRFYPMKNGPLSGIRVSHCPGHYSSLTALSFNSVAGQVWVVSDAVLDRDWLTAWEYFWPNGYGDEEIIETWRSVAFIISQADVIIPGHGDEILVTPQLIKSLIAEFPKADYADECPEVVDVLNQRLASMK